MSVASSLLADCFPNHGSFTWFGMDAMLHFRFTSTRMNFGFSDIGRALLFWQRRVIAGRRQGERLGPERYHELKYEDLIANTESTLLELSAFLQLEFQPEMLRYHERVDEVLKGMPTPQEDHPNLRRAPVMGLRDWRRDLATSDLDLADALVGPTLGLFGYERTESAPSGRIWSRALRLRAEANLLRARKALKTRVAPAPLLKS